MPDYAQHLEFINCLNVPSSQQVWLGSNVITNLYCLTHLKDCTNSPGSVKLLGVKLKVYLYFLWRASAVQPSL